MSDKSAMQSDASTERKVRIGIIGPSWWVDYWHLPGIQNHPHAEIVAVCGNTPRDEADVQSKYGPNARFYTDVDTMLDEAALDGVVVCTPNDLHGPFTLAALKHGVNVTCEKPIALDAAEAQEMLATARSGSLLAMANFPYRDNPCVQTVRRMIAEGYIGRLLHISGQYHGGFGLQRPPNWRRMRDRSGSGILGDLGSHLIDLAYFVTEDEIASVCAHTMTLLRDAESGEIAGLARSEDPRVGNRNDDSCAFLAELSSGAQGIFHTSWVAYQGAEAQFQQLDIYGTAGRIQFVATHAGTFVRAKKVGESQWENIPVANTVLPTPGVEEDEDYFRPGRHTSSHTTYRWIEAIRRGDTTITPDLSDGLRAQEVIDAVILASKERRWVTIQEIRQKEIRQKEIRPEEIKIEEIGLRAHGG